MTAYHDKTATQARLQLTEALRQVDRGRNITRDDSWCEEHLDHAQAAADDPGNRSTSASLHWRTSSRRAGP